MKIKANSISMNYETYGEGENLILIHGVGGNLNMWYHQVPVFSKRYHVIAYDVRGAGETESTEGRYSVPLFVEDFHEFMKALGVAKAHILGYSFGGRIAIETAISHPEMVKSLVISNSILYPTRPTRESVKAWRTHLESLEKGDIETSANRTTLAAFSPSFMAENPAEVEKYREMTSRNDPHGLTRLMRSLVTPAPLPDLTKIKCPVLLIMGANDPNLGVEQGEKASKEIDGSTLVIFPTGHATPIEIPDKFNSEVTGFLASLK